MLEIFIKNKKLIFRIFGVVMLMVAFVVHFWATPKGAMTTNEIAAANVARMEKHIEGKKAEQQSQSAQSSFLKELKTVQAKQMEYLTIIAMIAGIGFLGYSFIKRD